MDNFGPTWIKRVAGQYDNNPSWTIYAVDPAQIRDHAGNSALTPRYLEDIRSFAAGRGRNSSPSTPPALDFDLAREVQLYHKYFPRYSWNARKLFEEAKRRDLLQEEITFVQGNCRWMTHVAKLIPLWFQPNAQYYDRTNRAMTAISEGKKGNSRSVLGG